MVGALVVAVGASVELEVGAAVELSVEQAVPMLVPETLYARPTPPKGMRAPQMPSLSVTSLHSHNLPTISPAARRCALSSRDVSSGRSSTYADHISGSSPNSVGRGPVSSLSFKSLYPRSADHQPRLPTPRSQKSQRARAGVWVVHSQHKHACEQPDLSGDRS